MLAGACWPAGAICLKHSGGSGAARGGTCMLRICSIGLSLPGSRGIVSQVATLTAPTTRRAALQLTC